MTKLIKLNELVNALEPGEATEYGNITIKCEPGNRY